MRPITAMSRPVHGFLTNAARRRLLFCLILALAAGGLVLGRPMPARAADSPLKVSMGLSQNSFSGPKEITVTIKLTNASDGDLPGAVTLIYPNGDEVPDFAPVLGVGASETWKGKWKVTQTQITRGKITFGVKYPYYNDADELQWDTKYYSKTITLDASADATDTPGSTTGTGTVNEGDVAVTRTISHTTAGKGTAVTVAYEVVNNGTADITNVTVQENKSISSRSGTIGTVKAGAKKTYTFKVTMGTKDITSEGVVSYKAGGKTHKVTQTAETVKYAAIYLNATLKADRKGGAMGSTVKLTFQMKNTGTTPITDITVSDPLLGDIATFASLEGGKTETVEKEITIAASADYMFTVRGTKQDGTALEVSTGRVSVTALDPANVISLSLQLSSDRTEVYELPGTVKFTATVTNEGTSEVKEVSITSTGHTLYTFASIPAGESKTFSREVAVSMAGDFQFAAVATNQLSETETFPSNIVHIAYATPTAVPTDAPIVTPPAPQLVEIPTDDGLPSFYTTVQQLLGGATWLFGILAALLGGLILAVLAMRLRNRRESNQAYDHLEAAANRDYTKPHRQAEEAPQPVKRPIGDEEEVAYIPPAGETDFEAYEAGDEMSETLARLHRQGTEDDLSSDGEEPPAWVDDSMLEGDEPASALPAEDVIAEETDMDADSPADETGMEEQASAAPPAVNPYARPGTASASDFAKTHRSAHRRSRQTTEGEG